MFEGTAKNGAPIRLPSGRLQWRRDGSDLVAGRYRIHPSGPGRWETTRGGRLLRVDTRCSAALAAAEHHHREMDRVRQITLWGLSAGVGLLGAAIAGQWLSSVWGLLLFAAAVWVFLASLVRCVAALTRSLLDPYRNREPWEPSDWWNPHWSS